METEPDFSLSVCMSPSEARISSGLLQGQGLWLQQAWEMQHVSPTIEPLSRQPANWRTILPKKFLHCFKFWGPQQISQPGNPAKEMRSPRESDFEGQWDLITERPQEWGNRLLEGTNKTFCGPRPNRKEQWPTRVWARLACECPGASNQGMGQQWPAMGARGTE